jgi:hypothetical protein
MQVILGWILIVLPGSLVVIQLISSIDFALAQKLGLQEKSGEADPLLLRAERYVAYWDLVSLIWLPIAGIAMVLDHAWWPLLALAGAAIYLDAAGREAAKNLSFRHEGVKAGPQQQQKLFFATYIAMFLLGLVTLVYALKPLIELL